jgi:hypothetical protein
VVKEETRLAAEEFVKMGAGFLKHLRSDMEQTKREWRVFLFSYLYVMSVGLVMNIGGAFFEVDWLRYLGLGLIWGVATFAGVNYGLLIIYEALYPLEDDTDE